MIKIRKGRLCTRLIVALTMSILPVEAADAGRQNVPEYVITKPAGDYCESTIYLSPAASEVARSRLFDLMKAANDYTNGWRTAFAIVGVDYVDNDTFHLISFSRCLGAGNSMNFVIQFVEKWQRLHCKGRCQLFKPRVVHNPEFTFVIPESQFKFASQIEEFLHYDHRRDALSLCTIEIELPSETATGFPRTKLFGALMDLQRKFRFPISDISQIDQSLYLLISRQCSRKQELYEAMIWNLKNQDVSVDALHSVNFHPNVSDYLFSQTGHR